ncbi:MAG: hypothetical protein IJ064_05565 [Bacteroidaceae bacterium]|nr:hypothetical protein [Bacteroidaceae bacterium]
MRKRLAALLTRWAMKINPEATITAVVPQYEHYEANAIGTAQELTKNDLRKFKQKTGEKSSRKAMRSLIDETIRQQASRILNTANGIIEVSVYKRGESTVVESRLNVYVKKDSTTEESTDTSREE